MEIQGSNFYSGTSGLQLPIPKRDFPLAYAALSRLAYYATLFNSIEINSSFYKLPQPRTVERWVSETSADFKFTFKFWREVTHTKGLPFNHENVSKFMQVVRYAAVKKGCLLIQFPASVHVSQISQVRNLLMTIQEHNQDSPWPLAVEFRHNSWYTDTVFELLDNLGTAMVYHDMHKAETPLPEPWTDMVYLRFHGPETGYRGSYDDTLLSEYADYINDWLADGKTVYTYFNNTAGGALKNLMNLKSKVLK